MTPPLRSLYDAAPRRSVLRGLGPAVAFAAGCGALAGAALGALRAWGWV